MMTTRQQWYEFAKCIPATASQIQVREMRRAFLSGVFITAGDLIEAKVTSGPQAMLDLLVARYDEAMGEIEEMIREEAHDAGLQ